MTRRLYPHAPGSPLKPSYVEALSNNAPASLAFNEDSEGGGFSLAPWLSRNTAARRSIVDESRANFVTSYRTQWRSRCLPGAIKLLQQRLDVKRLRALDDHFVRTSGADALIAGGGRSGAEAHRLRSALMTASRFLACAASAPAGSDRVLCRAVLGQGCVAPGGLSAAGTSANLRIA